MITVQAARPFKPNFMTRWFKIPSTGRKRRELNINLASMLKRSHLKLPKSVCLVTVTATASITQSVSIFANTQWSNRGRTTSSLAKNQSMQCGDVILKTNMVNQLGTLPNTPSLTKPSSTTVFSEMHLDSIFAWGNSPIWFVLSIEAARVNSTPTTERAKQQHYLFKHKACLIH